MAHTAIDDERGLVRRLRRGDEAALATFTTAFLDPVFAFVYHRVAGDRLTAEDVTQETFLAALGGLERYDGRAGLYTWLCGIARHKIADHFRCRQRLEQARVALERAVDLSPEPGDDLEREERRRQVLAVLRDLPPHYQHVLTLKYLDRLSGRDLAGQLGMSEDAAESLLARARAAFRRAFWARNAEPREGETCGQV